MKKLKYKNKDGQFEDLYKVYQPVSLSKDKSLAVAGDVVMFDGTEKYVLKDTNEETLQAAKDAGHTPIGVVVIPTSHDVYGTGEMGVMSIVPMSYSTPDTGGTTEEGMYWGNIVLCNSALNRIVTTTNTSESTLGNDSSGYLPSDNQTSRPCVQDENVAYYYAGTMIPSPFLTDGSRNPDYYDISTSGGTAKNAFADFNGNSNTEVILTKISDTSWKTSALSNTANLYPAASCCWRFNTDGTNQGDWYLPSLGEFGYVVARYKTINYTINQIKAKWNVGVVLGTKYFWSSSEYSDYLAWYIYPPTGYVNCGNGHFKSSDSYHVRAFLRIK